MPGHWVWFTLPLLQFPGLHRVWVGRDYVGALSPRSRPGQRAWRSGRHILAEVRSVVAVAAHPDDLEYFTGGTLALLARQGARVVGVLATRGERGGRSPDLPARRMEEQRRAAERLGYAAMHVLDFPDRGVQAGDARLQGCLREILDQEQPDLLMTFDAESPFPVYHHPDHFAVARAALALWPGPSLLFHTRRPNVVMDISTTFRDKVAAFSLHRSQLPHRATARLVAWHLGSRSGGRDHRGKRRYVELFRVAGQVAGLWEEQVAAGDEQARGLFRRLFLVPRLPPAPGGRRWALRLPGRRR